MVAMSDTLTDRIKPVEIPGIGKGFKWAFNSSELTADLTDGAYKSDIGQIANGLSEAVTAVRGIKHLPVQDESSRVPMFLVKVDDTIPYTRYVVFASTVYAGKGQHLRGVTLIQDDTCDYDPTILENFVKLL